MATIVLTGGGTGGHVIPNLALLDEIYKYFDNVHYVGGNGIEEELVKKEGIPFHKTTTVKLDRTKLLSNAKIPFLFPKGIFEAKELLSEIAPNVIFSKGGYASLPTCYAGKLLNVPIVCHESDYTLGLANKIVSKFAVKTLTSFPETPNGIFVGNPIREVFLNQSKIRKPNVKLDEKKPVILICGGSLGSTYINEIIYNLLPTLLKSYNIIHIAGKHGNFDIKGKNYYQFSYVDDFPSYLSIADIVISRSGANTLNEIASMGKRCITIPLPKGASRGDQLLNAKSYEKRGHCLLLPQENLTAESLLNYIERVWYVTPNVLDASKTNKNIIKHILSVM